MAMDLRGKRVVVMGLGRFGGGVGVTRHLVRQGARVLVTDVLPREKLAASVAKLADLDVAFRLGAQDETDLDDADLLVANPAVRPDHPLLTAARQRGVAVTSEIRLLVSALPRRDRVVGVTGSAGKSTTTAMIGHAMSRLLGPDRVHLGGNIGGSLLDRVATIRRDDWVVLELSSFMLHGLADDRWSPHIAVLTNFSPNHLDWHGTVPHYRDAKQAIFDHQQSGDIAVVGPGVTHDFAPTVADVRQIDPAAAPIDLLLPGPHNQLNAHLATTAIHAACGLAPQAIHSALADFPGLPHRLQFVGDFAGVRVYNDSKSTTPDAARLAIDSFPPGVVHAILGGYDKGSDLTGLARHAAKQCRAVYTIGATGNAIAAAASDAVQCETLERAVAEARGRAVAGDVLLLSPGCASWDQFENYEQRGTDFVAQVQQRFGAES